MTPTRSVRTRVRGDQGPGQPKKLTEAQRKKRPCGACGKPVGTATIVCGGDFPDVPLCLACFYVDNVEAKIAARATGAK